MASPNPPAAMAAVAPEKLNFAYHVIVGLAAGLVAPFTALAWPFAMATGIVIGRSDVERILGVKPSASTKIIRLLAVTGGVIAMLAFGAIIFGLIAFVIVGLMDFNERLTARASANDQVIARILVFILAFAVWLVFIFAFHFSVHIWSSTPA